jgi:uncharacterized protein YbcI
VLAEMLTDADPMIMRGGIGSKTLAAIRAKLAEAIPPDPLLMMTTVPYGGEGFDAPIIDTVFLVGPISYPGLLKQAVGQALRRHEGKTEVHLARLCGHRCTRPERTVRQTTGRIPTDGVLMRTGAERADLHQTSHLIRQGLGCGMRFKSMLCQSIIVKQVVNLLTELQLESGEVVARYTAGEDVKALAWEYGALLRVVSQA